MGIARPVFGIVQKYCIVTLGLGTNSSYLLRKDPSNEGTLLEHAAMMRLCVTTLRLSVVPGFH